MRSTIIVFLCGIAIVRTNHTESTIQESDSVRRAKELVRDRDFIRIPTYNGSEYAAETYPDNATCKVMNTIERFQFFTNKLCPVTYDMVEIDEFLYADGAIRYRCHKYRPNEFIENKVYILSPSQLLKVINSPPKDPYKRSWCMVTFFYNPKCVFSEELAPAVNSMPFNYPSVVTVAVDATQFSRLNTRYGIAGTPNLLLWVGGVPISRMDDRPLNATGIMDFLSEWTDLESKRVSAVENYPLYIHHDPNQNWWETPSAVLLLTIALIYHYRTWFLRRAIVCSVLRKFGTSPEAVSAFFNGM